MSAPEIVNSKEQFIERIAARYKNQTINFRPSGDYEYAMLFGTRTTNMVAGIFDSKKGTGKIFDRRSVERE